MMKKTLLLTILSVLLTVLLLPAAPAEGLPDIDEALSDYRFSKSGTRVRVQNTLDEYSIFNDGEFDYDGLRFLILERRGPEMAFKESFIGCDDPNYTPTALGETALYLRLDLMDLLPADMRASSLEEADLLLIGEELYLLESQIIHTEYEDAGADSIPGYVDTPEELQAYLAAHPPVIKSRSYKPLFSAYDFLGLYSTKNRSVSVMDLNYADYTLTCNNDAASDQEGLISSIGFLLDLLTLEDPAGRIGEIRDTLDDLASVLPEETVALWQACVDAGQYSTAAFSAEQSYWEQAALLPPLDEDEEAAEWYPRLLEARDRGPFEAFAAYRNYSGVDTPDSVIIAEKLYIGQPDPSWIDEMLVECITVLLGE